jgi:hypothetical protein
MERRAAHSGADRHRPQCHRLRQAVAAGRWLKTAGIVALYSSDLKRAWTTALAIGAEIGWRLVPQLVPEMRERRYGVFEGLTYDEAQRAHPAGYAAFEGRNADYDFENGESLRRHVRTRHRQVAGWPPCIPAWQRGRGAAWRRARYHQPLSCAATRWKRRATS